MESIILLIAVLAGFAGQCQSNRAQFKNELPFRVFRMAPGTRATSIGGRAAIEGNILAGGHEVVVLANPLNEGGLKAHLEWEEINRKSVPFEAFKYESITDLELSDPKHQFESALVTSRLADGLPDLSSQTLRLTPVFPGR